MGNSEGFTMTRHILPNCIAPIIVLATSMFGWVLLAESGLSFLGLGVPPPAPTWGNMLSASRPFFAQAVWLGVLPGLCISLTLLGINLLGDAPPRQARSAHEGRLMAVNLRPVQPMRCWRRGADPRGRSDRPTSGQGLFALDDGGEIVGIVGESGSGKTMAARAIIGLQPPAIRRIAGTVRFEGRDLFSATPRELRRVRGARIGMVFQEPMTSLNPSMTVGRQIEEGLALHRPGDDAVARRALASRCCGASASPTRTARWPPTRTSSPGGMRQRIMLASVMLLEPALLIADEPTTALDAVIQRDVLDLMLGLTRDHGTAMLLISHDLPMVARYTDRMVVMQMGDIVEQGRTAELLLRPTHPYTAKLLAALPRRLPARPRPAVAPPAPRRGAKPGRGLRRPPPLSAPQPGKRAVSGLSLSIVAGEGRRARRGSGLGQDHGRPRHRGPFGADERGNPLRGTPHRPWRRGLARVPPQLPDDLPGPVLVPGSRA
jgi:ABC-type dipeptide/oligopeptide/nickel transport system ATPase component